jgi:hypothetical protein
MKTLILSVALSLLSITGFSQVKGGGQPSGQKQAGYGQGTTVTTYTRPTYTPPNNNTGSSQQSNKHDGTPQPKDQHINNDKGVKSNANIADCDIYVCPKCGYRSRYAIRCPKDTTLLILKPCK